MFLVRPWFDTGPKGIASDSLGVRLMMECSQSQVRKGHGRRVEGRGSLSAGPKALYSFSFSSRL